MFTYSKKIIVIQVAIIFFLVIDRFFKLLSINGVFDSPIYLIGDIFKLNFAKNYYIAFSLPISGIFLNILVSTIILFLIYFIIKFIKQKRTLHSALLSLIVFGAISNLADRLNYGFVIDYLDLKYFTIFNLADSMICVGAFGLILVVMKKTK